MTRFGDYLSVAESGTAFMDWRYDLLAPTGQVLATTLEDPGEAESWAVRADPVSSSADRISERALKFSFVPELDAHRPGHPTSVTHQDAGSRVRAYAGLNSPTGMIWWVQATMLIDILEEEVEAELSVVSGDLVDTLRPIRSNLCARISWAAGTPTEYVVDQILTQCGVRANLAPTGFSLPAGSLGAEADREQAIRVMLDGCGHELTTDAHGSVFSRPIPTADDVEGEERWYYGVGGLPVSKHRRRWETRSPKGWKVTAGGLLTSSLSIDLIVFDTDPRSEGFYSGPGETTVKAMQAPYIEGSNQAAVAGYGQLRRHGSGGGIVEFEASPNPAMRLHDLIELDLPDVSGTHRVIGFDLPLEVTGPMTVRARGVFDPGIGFSNPVDIGVGCLQTINDSFDRPDQNLHNVAASPSWTEIGATWRIAGQAAAQREDGRWGLAYINIPMCSSDQQATMQVGVIPSGRRMGPAVRASGSFECYAALVNSTGLIRLEVWQGGQSIRTIGQYQMSGSPNGATVMVKAVGPWITVDTAGLTEVIRAWDTSITGSQVGMLGYGGYEIAAPAAASFSGSVAT